MDGANYREGRVEVCVDGRWGTVCGEDWTEEEARLVCGRLGFSEKGKQFNWSINMNESYMQFCLQHLKYNYWNPKQQTSLAASGGRA